MVFTSGTHGCILQEFCCWWRTVCTWRYVVILFLVLKCDTCLTTDTKSCSVLYKYLQSRSFRSFGFGQLHTVSRGNHILTTEQCVLAYVKKEKWFSCFLTTMAFVVMLTFDTTFLLSFWRSTPRYYCALVWRFVFLNFYTLDGGVKRFAMYAVHLNLGFCWLWGELFLCLCRNGVARQYDNTWLQFVLTECKGNQH